MPSIGEFFSGLLEEIAAVIIEEDGSAELPLDLTISGVPAGELVFSLSGDNEALLTTDAVLFEEDNGIYSMRLVPSSNAHGTVNLVLTVKVDGRQSSQAFQLVVLPVDDPPIVEPVEALTIDEDATGRVTLLLSDLDSPADELRVELLDSGNPVMLPEGSIRIEQDGFSFPIEILPRSHVFGTARLQLQVFDQANTVDVAFDLAVRSVNDAPTLTVEPSIEILEGTSATIPFEIDDVDTAIENLEVAVRSLSEAIIPTQGLALQGEGTGRQLRIVPAPDAFGDATVEFEVGDGETSSKVLLSVRVLKLDDSPNLAPLPSQTMAEDEVALIDLELSDRDTPREALVLSAVASNEFLFPVGSLSFLSIAGTDQLRLQPAVDAEGESDVTVMLSDGVNLVQEVFHVKVTGVNDAPRISGLNDIVVEPGTATRVRFEVFDPDNDLSRLFVALATLNPELIRVQGVEVEGNGRSREFDLNLIDGQVGTGVVIVGASDGKLVSTSRFSVEVASQGGVEPDPARLEIGIENGVLRISWAPPGTLLSSDSVEGPFQVVPGATSPFLLDPVEAQRYFQVLSP